MMDIEKLEEQLAELPLYAYQFITPDTLEYTERVRWICQHECPMYGKTWACPPAVGSVSACAEKCRPLLDRDVADPWYTGDFTATWEDICEGCRKLMEELC